MPMSESTKRSRAIAGGMAARSTNRWYYLRKVTGHDKFGQETLECGHAQRPKSDMIGEYSAYRRRCWKCPKPTIRCGACDGTGAVPGPREVLHRCTDCQGDGRFLAKPAVLPETWFNALGQPVSAAGREAACELLIAEGCDPGETSMVVHLAAREIEHDEPEQAQKTLRGWLPAHGSEILLIRTLAVLCCTPHLVRADA